MEGGGTSKREAYNVVSIIYILIFKLKMKEFTLTSIFVNRLSNAEDIKDVLHQIFSLSS